MSELIRIGANTMKDMNLFPLGLAEDAAFCNRVQEQNRLKANIRACRHTILVAPRRYGKTSLAFKVLTNENYLHVKADFLLASSEESVESILLCAVGRLIGQLIPFQKRAMDKIREFMGSLSPRFVLSSDGPYVEFLPTQKPRQALVDCLIGLDRLAVDQGKTVVVFLDEFQQLASLKDNEAIEAAIRHAAQSARNTSYIFSGSNRHLLTLMFQDSSRPLYHLCDQITLTRIAREHYEPFIQHASRQKWNALFPLAALEMIFERTELHPYYMNVLCARLWTMDQLPTLDDVKEHWLQYVAEQSSRVASELSELSPNQRGLIHALAYHPSKQLTSKTFLQKIKLASASAIQALKQLQEKDLILRDEDGVLRLLDPVIQCYIINTP
jgi:AAA+ ATPase superfamily predicted ATPase